MIHFESMNWKIPLIVFLFFYGNSILAFGQAETTVFDEIDAKTFLKSGEVSVNVVERNSDISVKKHIEIQVYHKKWFSVVCELENTKLVTRKIHQHRLGKFIRLYNKSLGTLQIPVDASDSAEVEFLFSSVSYDLRNKHYIARKTWQKMLHVLKIWK